MMIIRVNNTTMKEQQAIKEAREIYDQTGESVEVCSALGDTIFWIREDGKEFWY